MQNMFCGTATTLCYNIMLQLYFWISWRAKTWDGFKWLRKTESQPNWIHHLLTHNKKLRQTYMCLKVHLVQTLFPVSTIDLAMFTLRNSTTV